MIVAVRQVAFENERRKTELLRGSNCQKFFLRSLNDVTEPLLGDHLHSR